MLVDVHTHFMRSAHWGCEWRDHWQPVYGRPWKEVTVEDYDQAMSDVDVALVFGIRATAAGVATPHEELARFSDSTRTNTIGFMALDPSDPDALEQMEYGVELGLKGVKLYPVLALFDATDPAYDGFFNALIANRLPVLWHIGATPSPAGDLRLSMPMMIDDVARRHPDLVQIMAHMGHPWQRETLAVLRKNHRVFADVSASWARPFDGFHALVRAQEWGVVDKLLFGSDFPLWTPAEAIKGLFEISELRAGGLPHVATETVEQILDQEALSLLGLNSRSHGKKG